MNDPILSRQSISEDAKLAAERCITTHAQQVNPHLDGTDAHAQWRADYCRWLLALSAEEGCEGSA